MATVGCDVVIGGEEGVASLSEGKPESVFSGGEGSVSSRGECRSMGGVPCLSMASLMLFLFLKFVSYSLRMVVSKRCTCRVIGDQGEGRVLASCK